MARDLTSGMQAEVQAPVLRPVIFYEGEFSTGTLRLWSGLGTISWNGQTWTGAGNAIGISEIAETADIRAAGVTASLSGNVSSLIAAALAEARYGKPGKVWLGCFGDETLESGTAQAGSTNTLTLAAGASGEINAHANKLLRLTGGVGSVQERSVFTYDGVTKVATVSPRWRTNLILHSEELTTIWAHTDGGGFVTANAATAPDGAATADRVGEASGVNVNGHGVRQSFTVVSGVTYVLSYYAKAAGRTRCSSWQFVPVDTTANSIFDLSAGTVAQSSPAGATITALPNGWYRCTDLFTATASGTVTVHIQPQDSTATQGYSGDGTSGVYIWGVQVEAVAIAGDYIKTTAAAVALPDATTTYDVIDENGIVADPYLAFVGRLDVPVIDDAGQSCVISMQYESRLIDLQRTRERRWTHEDQQIDFPGDLGFEYVTSLPDQVLIW